MVKELYIVLSVSLLFFAAGCTQSPIEKSVGPSTSNPLVEGQSVEVEQNEENTNLDDLFGRDTLEAQDSYNKQYLETAILVNQSATEGDFTMKVTTVGAYRIAEVNEEDDFTALRVDYEATNISDSKESSDNALAKLFLSDGTELRSFDTYYENHEANNIFPGETKSGYVLFPLDPTNETYSKATVKFRCRTICLECPLTCDIEIPLTSK